MLFFTALSRGKDWNLHHLTSQILRLMSAHLILGKGKTSWFCIEAGGGLVQLIPAVLPRKVGASRGGRRGSWWEGGTCYGASTVVPAVPAHCSLSRLSLPRTVPQRCYCAINVPLLWYRRFSVTSALILLLKSGNALAWPETGCEVCLCTPCSRSGNMWICYSQRQNSQVGGRNQPLVICSRIPKGKWQVSG